MIFKSGMIALSSPSIHMFERQISTAPQDNVSRVSRGNRGGLRKTKSISRTTLAIFIHSDTGTPVIDYLSRD